MWRRKIEKRGEEVAAELGTLTGASARPPRSWRPLAALAARPLSQPHEWAVTSGRTYALRLARRRWALSLSPEVWAARLKEPPPLTPLDAGERARYEALRRSLPSDWLKPLLACVAVSVADDLERGVGTLGVGPLRPLHERCDELASRGLAHALMGLDLRREAEGERLLRAARDRCWATWESADPWVSSGASLGRGLLAGGAWRGLCERLERLAGATPRLSALLAALGDASAPPESTLVDETPASALLKLYAQLSRDVSHACQWAWVHISAEPRWREALAHEVRGALGERPYSEEALASLPALHAVLLELSRLYPPVWREALMSRASQPSSGGRYGGRRAAEPHSLDGLSLSGATLLLSLPFWLHRDERVWEEPSRWRPSRRLTLSAGAGEGEGEGEGEGDLLVLLPPRGLLAPFGLPHDPKRADPREEIWTHAVAALLTSVLRRGAYDVRGGEEEREGEEGAAEAPPPRLRGGGLAPPEDLRCAFCVSERLTYVPSERL